MKIKNYILDSINEKGTLLFSLIDPLDYENLDKAINTAKACIEGNTDVILIGGSIGVEGELLDSVTEEIKKHSNVPIILFPGNISTLTKYADAVYFMSLLNSRNPYWITGAQTLASMKIKKLGIEPLSVGYIVIEPGGTVGWVGDANKIPRNKENIACSMALAAQHMGFNFVLTDAGSNPTTGHIPFSMAKKVAKTIDIPYFIGGGVKTNEQIEKMASVGVNVIQVGTAFENIDFDFVKNKVIGFKNSIKEGVKKR